MLLNKQRNLKIEVDEARGLIRPPPPVSAVYDSRDSTYGKLHFTSTPTGEGGRRNEIRLGKVMVETRRMKNGSKTKCWSERII